MPKHDPTLEAVFAEPTRGNVAWNDIVGLLEHRGAEIAAGRGSRVRVALNGVRAIFHRPHAGREMKRGALRAMRDFLFEAEIQPP